MKIFYTEVLSVSFRLLTARGKWHFSSPLVENKHNSKAYTVYKNNLIWLHLITSWIYVNNLIFFTFSHIYVFYIFRFYRTNAMQIRRNERLDKRKQKFSFAVLEPMIFCETSLLASYNFLCQLWIPMNMHYTLFLRKVMFMIE